MCLLRTDLGLEMSLEMSRTINRACTDKRMRRKAIGG